MDTNFNLCGYTTGCVQIGIGGFAGAGLNGVIGGPQPLGPGRTQSWGVFANYGAGASTGVSANFSKGQFSAGKAFYGPGGGAVVGVQFCETNMAACLLPRN